MSDTPLPVAEAAPQPPIKEPLLTRFARFRRGPWEALATIIIGVGVVMLMQSFWIEFYTWSFLTILAGTALFVSVSHFKD
jgi:hypothetical protein